MPRKPTHLPETASQTAGPYVHIGLAPADAGFEIYDRELGRDIAGPDAEGTRIRVEGVVYDGSGAPVLDVLVEAWQANAAGVYAHPEDPSGGKVEDGFRGWGRAIADFETGLWRFDTVKPGQVSTPGGGLQAPHVNLWLVARGINIGLNTRLYFEDEADANAADPLLTLIGQPDRRETLIARRTDERDTPVYRFDIRLQGEGETVFLDI